MPGTRWDKHKDNENKEAIDFFLYIFNSAPGMYHNEPHYFF